MIFFFLTECFLSTHSVACPVGNIPPLQNLSLVLPSSYSALHNRASLSFHMTINNSAGKSARERSRAEETMGILVTLTYLLGAVALSGWPLSRDASCYQHSQPSSLCWPLPWPQAGPWDPHQPLNATALTSDIFMMESGGFSSLLLHFLPEFGCTPASQGLLTCSPASQTVGSLSEEVSLLASPLIYRP